MMALHLKRLNNLALIGIGSMFLLVLPLFMNLGWVSLINEMLILGLAACALNLMFGYAGMVCFGPAGFYAIGAYTTALLLLYTKVPISIALICGPILAGIVSVVVGWFSVRLTHVYFALLTLAFSEIIHTIIFEWYELTRGDDGIVDIPVPKILMPITNYYYFSLLIIIIALAIMWRIVKSPFGKTLEAIRENPERIEFLGINVRWYRLKAFIISGIFLGLAGSLFCGFNKNVFPAYSDMVKSTEILVVCLLGGYFYFFGPIVGSVVYIFLDKIVTSQTEYWPLILGIIIIGLLLFLRGGIVGFIAERFREVKGKDGGK